MSSMVSYSLKTTIMYTYIIRRAKLNVNTFYKIFFKNFTWLCEIPRGHILALGVVLINERRLSVSPKCIRQYMRASPGWGLGWGLALVMRHLDTWILVLQYPIIQLYMNTTQAGDIHRITKWWSSHYPWFILTQHYMLPLRKI